MINIKSKVWFTADTHWNHGNIIKYCNRPFLSDFDREALEANGGVWHNGSWKGEFASDHYISREAIYEMNDTLIKNINDCVQPQDTLYHLGDVLFAKKHEYVDKAYGCLSRVNCKNIHLILGNHDEPHLTNSRGETIEKYFRSVHNLHEIFVDNQRITLCHYAMAVFNKSHRGSWQLYGHSHSGAEPWLDRVMKGRRSMDVGVDNAYKLLGAYRPFSFEEIQEIMKDRHGCSIDHHIDPNTPTEESLINND